MNEMNIVVAIISAVAAATWLVRSKLSDLEAVLKGHVASADERYNDHDRRIVKLEDYHSGRR